MKKALSITLVVLMLFSLAACGGGTSSSSSPNLLPPVSSQPPPATSVSDSIPEEVVELERAMLTGLPKGDNYPEDMRCIGVMVNNIASSRPTSGLSEAKILVEIKVEGGITRFMAIFEDYKNMPVVGGVRSARDQFFQLLLPLWGFYVHEGPGANSPVGWMMKDYGYSDFDLDNAGGGFRKDRPGMSYEYTLYTSGEHVTKTVQNKNMDDFRSYGSPLFDFVPYNEPARIPGGGAAGEVAVIHSASYRSLFQYNSSTQKYEMSQWNSSRGGLEKTVDENNSQQLAFDNLLVLFAPMQIYPGTQLVKVDYSSGGGGYYISQGHFEPLIWRKGAANEPLRLESIDGSESKVFLNPGTSYIAVVDHTLIEDFDATLRAGKGSEAAGSGTVNPNEAETED